MTSQERQGFGKDGKTAGTFGTTVLFDETTAKALRLAKRRKWTLIGAVVFFLAIGIGAIIGANIASERQKDVAREYIKIESEYSAATKAFQEKMSAGGMADPLARPDYKDVAKKFTDFANRHMTSPLGWDAALRAARIDIDEKNLAEAQKLLEPLVAKTLKFNLVQIKIRRALAGIYAEKGEFDRALAEIDFIEKISDNPIIDEIKLLKGQIYYMAGRKEDAAKTMRELSTKEGSGVDATGQSVAAEASMWLGYWGL